MVLMYVLNQLLCCSVLNIKLVSVLGYVIFLGHSKYMITGVQDSYVALRMCLVAVTGIKQMKVQVTSNLQVVITLYTP